MRQLCSVSGTEFEIAPDDLRFYDRLGVPAPTLCPAERQRRRLAWRNERKLYRRECSATGKSIISVHRAGAPFVVVAQDYWWSDNWDPKSFGLEFDFSRPFFEQFADLQRIVPRIALQNGSNENSEFVNLSTWNKDCYLLFESDSNRECFYCDHSFSCISCCDLSYVTRSELCYECLYCDRCYNCSWLQNCENCADSFFLKNCISCSNCFGCVNLRQKRYCLWNRQCTPEEYHAALAGLGLDDRLRVQLLGRKFAERCRHYPVKYYEGRQNEQVVGNYIWESKDVRFCFDVRNIRDCKWVCNCENSRDCYDIDVYGGERGMELVYEGHSVGNGVFNCAFNTCLFQNVADSYYCDFCHFSHDLFGCIGLRHCEYCVLNKQYSKADYFSLKGRIIRHMCLTGEWGQFFPIDLSPFAYNETVAQEYYTLSRAEALSRGWNWHGEEQPSTEGLRHCPATIDQIPNGKEIWLCARCKTAYRFQTLELSFYRRRACPPPDECHECRYEERMTLRLPRRLYDRSLPDGCRCLSPYAPERPERVLSEAEYEQALV